MNMAGNAGIIQLGWYSVQRLGRCLIRESNTVSHPLTRRLRNPAPAGHGLLPEPGGDGVCFFRAPAGCTEPGTGRVGRRGSGGQPPLAGADLQRGPAFPLPVPAVPKSGEHLTWTTVCLLLSHSQYRRGFLLWKVPYRCVASSLYWEINVGAVHRLDLKGT